MESENNYLKYHSGKLYLPEKPSNDFPFLEGNIVRGKSFKVFGEFLGYDKDEKTGRTLGVIRTSDGSEFRDFVQNLELAEN
jgi:hypothetical protein